MFKRFYNHVMQDSLYRNSLYLMSSTIVTAMFGFIFWVVNARLFPPGQIGIATAIISATALISEFSLLGLKNGIVRFLPQATVKNNNINTGANIIILVAFFLSFGFILLVPFISPKLISLHANPVYGFLFIIFVISFTLNQFQEGIFIAYRSSGFILSKNTLGGITKVFLPFFLFSLGAYGVFFAFSFGSVISFIFGFIALIKRFNYRFARVIQTNVLKKMGKFSFANYLGEFCGNIPQFVLPLIIINALGAKQSAYYYIDAQIGSLLYVIPVAATLSLFAEGSYNEEQIKQHLRKAFYFILVLLIPAIIFIMIFGGYGLRFFGNSYETNGLQFLRLLAIGGIFISVNCIGSAVINIKKKVSLYIFFNILQVVLVLTFTYFLLQYGLIGVGFALLMGEGISALLYLIYLRAILL